MWVVHISEGEKLYIVNLWRVYIIITALNSKITLKQICPTLHINVLENVRECSNLWLTLNIPTFSSSWTANVAPQGNRPKFLLYSFCSTADYLPVQVMKSMASAKLKVSSSLGKMYHLLIPSAWTNKSLPEIHFCPQDCSNPCGADNSLIYCTERQLWQFWFKS